MKVNNHLIDITDLYARMRRETFDEIPTVPKQHPEVGDCWRVQVPRSDKWFLLWIVRHGNAEAATNSFREIIIVKDV